MIDDKDFEAEAQRILSQHMEAVLVRLGRADLRCQELRQKASVEEDPEHRRNMNDAATLATQQLEIIAGQAIELGRALALRDDPVPAIPQELPQAVKDHADGSAYQGRAGLRDLPEIVISPRIKRGEA